LKNSFVRIILRTGQPGKAPEKKVIMEYDINGYKEKTELTAPKLFTTITSSLRSYRDMRTIDKARKVLELVIQSSGHPFGHQSFKRFASRVLSQILSILRLDENSLYVQILKSEVSTNNNNLYITAATGRFNSYVDHYVNEIKSIKIQNYLNTAIERKESFFIDDAYLGYFNTKSGFQSIIFLNGCGNLTDLEKDLIRIFSSNVAIAFDNMYLSQEIVDTQKEVIFTLGELVDTRSKGTANHVRRVAEFSYLLALKAGIEQDKTELMKLASPMHDIGKIGIPDSVLNKPDKLNESEYELIKTHSGIGYDILKKSRREILKAATIIAREHHERWDGQGYPQGLKENEIHISGRITGLADVFDALTHSRVYKNAWPNDHAIQFIREQRGKHFDPELVDLFLENTDEFIAINDRYPEENS
jgi:response regulator RpfG family c-di-GMP phosphodiesterase